MYKNPKSSAQQFKSKLPDYLVNRESASYSQTPVAKQPTKRPFQPDLLNRSMENKQRYSEKQYEPSPQQKSKTSQQQNPSYYSQDAPLYGRSSKLPNYEPTRCSTQRNGIIKAYAANTNQGIVRDYNEDRVSIILNIIKPQNRAKENWPKCSFFGVYDGHGGSACADFLRDNLHQFVIKETDFPWNPYEALRKGFLAAEQAFTDYASEQFRKGLQERSGSCAIVALIVGEICYIANVGDSRAVLCGNKGKKILQLSRDHKPCDELEQLRIQKAGGKIYQTQAQQEDSSVIYGPIRVLPGRLSVSRTFGDIEAKLEKLGGKPNVVIAEPELRSFKIQEDHEFIVLASDGIYDKMSSKDVVDCVVREMENATQDLHAACSQGVEAVLKESINRRTMDNVTAVVVSFQSNTNNTQSIQQDKWKIEMEKRILLKQTVQQVLRNSYENQKLGKHQHKQHYKEDQENNPQIDNTVNREYKHTKLIC